AIPTVATFAWNRDNRRMTQTDLVLRPVTVEGEGSTSRRSTFLSLLGDNYPDGDAYDYFIAGKMVSEVLGTPMASWSADAVGGAAIHPVAYDSCRVISLGG